MISQDLLLNHKSILPQKLLETLSVISGTNSANSIFVDEVESFIYEDTVYGLSAFEFDALITSGEINVGASATAIVSAAGTISIDITNAGSGYLSAPSISIRPPIGSGTTTGIGSTALATTTITNGTVTDTTLTAVGFGYTHSNPPEVIIELPTFQTEKVTSFDEIQGFTGIITGITTTTTNSGAQAALKFSLEQPKQFNLDFK